MDRGRGWFRRWHGTEWKRSVGRRRSGLAGRWTGFQGEDAVAIGTAYSNLASRNCYLFVRSDVNIDVCIDRFHQQLAPLVRSECHEGADGDYEAANSCADNTADESAVRRVLRLQVSCGGLDAHRSGIKKWENIGYVDPGRGNNQLQCLRHNRGEVGRHAAALPELSETDCGALHLGDLYSLISGPIAAAEWREQDLHENLDLVRGGTRAGTWWCNLCAARRHRRNRRLRARPPHVRIAIAQRKCCS